MSTKLKKYQVRDRQTNFTQVFEAISHMDAVIAAYGEDIQIKQVSGLFSCTCEVWEGLGPVGKGSGKLQCYKVKRQ